MSNPNPDGSDELQIMTKRSMARVIAESRGSDIIEESDSIAASNCMMICTKLINAYQPKQPAPDTGDTREIADTLVGAKHVEHRKTLALLKGTPTAPPQVDKDSLQKIADKLLKELRDFQDIFQKPEFDAMPLLGVKEDIVKKNMALISQSAVDSPKTPPTGDRDDLRTHLLKFYYYAVEYEPGERAWVDELAELKVGELMALIPQSPDIPALVTKLEAEKKSQDEKDYNNVNGYFNAGIQAAIKLLNELGEKR